MTAARLRGRLDRLEKALAVNAASRRPCDMLFLDLAGRILWDGTEAMREWAGRHNSAWPAEWENSPWSMKRIVGVDPLAVFGLEPALRQPFDAVLRDA